MESAQRYPDWKAPAEDGKPLTFVYEAGEKVYADFQLTFTDPGGPLGDSLGSAVTRLTRESGKMEA